MAMLRRLHRWLTTPHVDHSRRELAWSFVVAAALALGALIGVGWIAGYYHLAALIRQADWNWFAIALAGEAVAYVGYTVAYRELARVGKGHPLELPRALAAVASGFGLFIPRGGFAADHEAFVEMGFHKPEARRRILGLGALEYALLAPAACVAAIYLLVRHVDVPMSFTLPWAIAVPVGFALAVVLLGRRERWHERGGLRGQLAHGLDIVALLHRLAERPRDHGIAAALGMAVYWVGDVFCLWACLVCFLGHSPPLAALVVGYATGYALTRRGLPLAGAGPVEALLPFALYWMKIPLAPAVLAVAAYRVFNLWLPFVPALAGREIMTRQRRRERSRALAESRASAGGARGYPARTG